MSDESKGKQRERKEQQKKGKSTCLFLLFSLGLQFVCFSRDGAKKRRERTEKESMRIEAQSDYQVIDLFSCLERGEMLAACCCRTLAVRTSLPGRGETGIRSDLLIWEGNGDCNHPAFPRF